MNGKKSYSSFNTKQDIPGTPPNDTSEEAALIGAILNTPAYLFDVRSLMDDGEVFYEEAFRIMYKALTVIYDRGETIRPILLIRELRNTGNDSVLYSHPISDLEKKGFMIGGEVLNTARYLRELYIKRIAIERATELREMALANAPVDEIIDKSRTIANVTSGKMNVSREVSLTTIIGNTIKAIEEAGRIEGGLVGVNTGFGKINKLTGGLYKEELVILAGRPGMMKTGVGLYMVYNAAKAGVASGWVSGEMKPEQNLLRLMAMLTGIPYSMLRRGRHADGRKFSAEDWQAIHNAAGEIEQLPIHFDTRPAPDINDITYLALEWQQRHGLGFIGFDYIQIFADRQAGKSDFEQATSISKKSKQLAIRMGCPVLALSQLSRAVETRGGNRRPQLSDLRQTGQIEQDADIVMALYRDDYYKQQAAKEQGVGPPVYDYELEIELLKNRSGEPRMVKLWADPATNRMADEAPGMADPFGVNARQLPVESERNPFNNFPSGASSFE